MLTALKLDKNRENVQKMCLEGLQEADFVQLVRI